MYNWKSDIENVFSKYHGEDLDALLYRAGEQIVFDGYGESPAEESCNIIGLWEINKGSKLYYYLKDWYGSEKRLKRNVRNLFEVKNSIYFVTGCNYDIWSADLLGGNADGIASRSFDNFVYEQEMS